LPIWALQVPAVEPGVLRPPAHRGWLVALVVGIGTSAVGLHARGAVRVGASLKSVPVCLRTL
jgi:hypothetical protein